MRNGWTGGQFSLVRSAFALTFGLWVVFGGLVAGPSLDAVIAFALVLEAAFLFVGAYVRVIAAIHLGCALVMLRPWIESRLGQGSAFVFESHGWWVVGEAFFAVLLLLPRAPYGSWPARRRVDPGGGWEFRPQLFALLWGFWIAFHAAVAVMTVLEWRATNAELGASELLRWVARGLFLSFAWSSRTRPWAWFSLVGYAVAGAFGGTADSESGPVMWALVALTFDPAWVAPRVTAAAPLVFFDGGCALCHGLVRFALAEDRDGTRLCFAPLDGATAQRELAAHRPLPDSVVVLADGAALVRSRAVARVLEALGGLWRVAAWGVYFVPAGIADRVYDFIAARRKRWFAPPKSACPMLPPELARRIGA